MSDQIKKKDKTVKKPKAVRPAQPPAAGTLQQMQQMFNQAIFHKGNKKLDMSGNLRDTNAPTGLDWLEKFGPNRPEVAERRSALGRELRPDGGINAMAEKGRGAVEALKFLQGRGGEPTGGPAIPAIQPEFVGPTQPSPATVAPRQLQNPNALLPTLERDAETVKRNAKGFWDSFVTGEGPAVPNTALVEAFNPLLGPAMSAVSDPMGAAKRMFETFVPTAGLLESGVKAGTDWLSGLFEPERLPPIRPDELLRPRQPALR